MWFQRQSRPMFHKIKRKKRGHRERERDAESEKGREKEKHVQHEEDSRPNSASIVHVAWLTF